jgi:predicted nuclease of restriction endonuclease-like (RecB) superfamily
MAQTPALPDDYPELLERLEAEISSARTRAALAVNEELIGLYWRLGREILERQEQEGWGTRVTTRLSADLREAFPEMRGLSVRNLVYMRQFAASWPDSQIAPQPVAQLPWGHNLCHSLWHKCRGVDREGKKASAPRHKHVAWATIDRRPTGQAAAGLQLRAPQASPDAT